MAMPETAACLICAVPSNGTLGNHRDDCVEPHNTNCVTNWKTHTADSDFNRAEDTNLKTTWGEIAQKHYKLLPYAEPQGVFWSRQ